MSVDWDAVRKFVGPSLIKKVVRSEDDLLKYIGHAGFAATARTTSWIPEYEKRLVAAADILDDLSGQDTEEFKWFKVKMHANATVEELFGVGSWLFVVMRMREGEFKRFAVVDDATCEVKHKGLVLVRAGVFAGPTKIEVEF